MIEYKVIGMVNWNRRLSILCLSVFFISIFFAMWDVAWYLIEHDSGRFLLYAIVLTFFLFLIGVKDIQASD